MRRSTERVHNETLSFPILVTFGALATALLLLLTSTLPALRERQELDRVLTEHSRLRRDYVDRLVELRRPRTGNSKDLQALLVAIDGLGLTPAELIALHPAEAEAEDTVDRQ
jgi:hypothetical protein